MPRTGTVPDTEFVTYGHSVTLRGAHYAIVGSTIDIVDHVGDAREQRALGRVVGEYGEPIGAEEVITSRSVPVNLGGESGWLWRTQSSTLSGHDPLTGAVFSPPSPVTYYNAVGDVSRQTQLVQATWDYELGPGTDGSLAYRSTDQTIVASTTYDAWGNSTHTCGGGDIAAGSQVCLRYATVTYEPTYMQFPSSEAISTGFGGGDTLASAATLDEGLGALLTVTDPNGQSTSVTYDGFGRLTSMKPPALGYSDMCTRAATVLEYLLTATPSSTPVNRVHSTTSLNCAGSNILESWAYVDGLGTPRASLATGDTASSWIRSGISLNSKRGSSWRTYHHDAVSTKQSSGRLYRGEI
jgi:YD repeat-containing protein